MAPRTMWKGAISFGLVSIPVRVFPATEEKTLRFNQLHDADGGRIRMQRVCAACGEVVEFSHIVKGYEVEKDSYVMITDEDFDSVPVKSSRAIDIVQFVELDEIDPIYFKKSYYLVPEETGVKAYALLREALADQGRVGVAKVSFRDKEHLATLRFRDEAFVLETMYWPDEIRADEFEELDTNVEVRDQEVQMARSLIESLSEAWNPEMFTDEYREAMLKVVEAKAEGQTIEISEEEAPAKVLDLMEALKASVAAIKSDPEPKPAAGSGSSAKRSAAKKSAAKKSTAKKAAAPKKKAAAG